MANRIRDIVVSDEGRAELERLVRASSTPSGVSRRARAILLMAVGTSGVEIAEKTGYTVVQISRLRRRFAEEGVAGLFDRKRSGRPPLITARKTAQVVAKTLRTPKPGLTHWTTRDMAREVNISHSTVHRIWQAHDLQPHRVQTFKFTKDPNAEEKIHDVVGLYLNPPNNAVVLSVDEKTQIQALRLSHFCPCVQAYLPDKRTTTGATVSSVSMRRSKRLVAELSASAASTTPRRTFFGSSTPSLDASAEKSSTSSWTTRPRTLPPRSRRGSLLIHEFIFISHQKVLRGSTS